MSCCGGTGSEVDKITTIIGVKMIVGDEDEFWSKNVGDMSPHKKPTTARFELARSKSNGLAIHLLNHSDTLSYSC